MKREQTKQIRERQAAVLAAKCYLILDAIEANVDDDRHRPILALKRKGIGMALAKNDVAALTMAYRDAREDVEALPPGDRAELAHRLEATFGINIKDEIQGEIARSHLILRRGKIDNREEYSLLRVFIEQHANRTDATLLDLAIRMVSAFEKTM